MASKKTKKASGPQFYSPKPCPSCNPSTKHECDACNGTGVFGGSPDHQNCRFPGCDRPIPPGDDFEPDVCDQHRTKDLNNRFDDLHSEDTPMEESTEILIAAIAEDSEDIVPVFHSLMTAKLRSKLTERATLEELYLDSSDHPEVKELIRQGFRLKKSRGDRDVLEGPGGERRVIKRKNGKVHVVREGTEEKIPCDHCDENGYSQKYKATCRVCKGTKLRSEFRMPEDFARVEDDTRALGLQQMKARGEDRINFAPLRDRKGPSTRRRLSIKSNKGIKEDVSGLAEGTHQTIWDESGEQVGYYGPAGEPSEQGEFIWGHTPSGVVGHSRSLDAAKERLKQTHFAHVGKEVPLREETVTEVSKATLASYIDKAVDDHADYGDHGRKMFHNAGVAQQQGAKPAHVDYYDEQGEKYEHKAGKRKEGIMRAVRKLTKEEQELFEDPFLTPAKLHKYISFGREDLYNAERSKRDDLGRANRHEDEASNAKTDDDRNFHNDRAKAFSKSAAMTDKAMALRKKGLATAAKRLLKTGGAAK